MRTYSWFVALLLGMAAPLAAQWESPTFFSPHPGEDLGVYAWNPAGGLEWGVGAIWRQEGNLNLGVRVGLSEGSNYHVGAEFYGPLNLLGPQSQLLMSWLLGVGATFDGLTWLRVPAGVSLGLNLGTPGSVQLKPYVFPRVAFDLFAEDIAGEEETSTEFNVDVDLGADVALGSSFVLRVGYTLGITDSGFNTIGAGIAYRMPRRVAVR
jgi:hypothetical protein